MNPARGIAGSARAALALAAALSLAPARAQVASDDAFRPSIAAPAYAPGAGPRVVVDEAHRNLHTATGRYAAFAAVATADGFRVEPGTARFEAATLPPAGSILVVANAQGAETPDATAFDVSEIAALVAWVEAGGALFVIADHAPFGTAAASLTAAFGVVSHDGHVEDAEHAAPGLPGPYFLLFSRANGLLGDHAILAGRNESERVDAVISFGGQALEAGSASVLLRLGAGARVHSAPNTAEDRVEPIGGRAQMVALERGRGRVVIAGEAGMFAAQTIRGEAAARAGVPDPFHFGMTHPGGQNQQLLINSLRWLVAAVGQGARVEPVPR